MYTQNNDSGQINQQEYITQILRLHQKASILWQDKKKYLQSMRKSCAEIQSIKTKSPNQERIHLIAKLRKHIDRTMEEYVPVIEQLSTLKDKAKIWQNQASQILKQSCPSAQLLMGYEYALEISQIFSEATSFDVNID